MPRGPAAFRDVEGTIFGLDQTAVHDGPGVRMNVYLKGCPLRCTWCHSPESQAFHPEVVWYETKCSRCGQCLGVCPEGARSIKLIDRDRQGQCRLCGVCMDTCPAGAIEVKGRVVTAGDMAGEAERLKPFFRRTGGGVTLTGGEPTAQPEFSCALGSLCRDAGIHVAMETCGFAEWSVLARLSEVVDLFLFDVKHIAADLHEQHTGVSNDRIGGNLQRLLEAGADVVARVPLIPSVNDDPDTIRAIGKTLLERGARRVTLLSYNPATPAKYSWLHREPPLPHATRQSPEHIEALQRLLLNEGLQIIAP